MYKTVVFCRVARLRADFVTDNTEYGFYLDVVDSLLVGDPEERVCTTRHKIKVGITWMLLVNW